MADGNTADSKQCLVSPEGAAYTAPNGKRLVVYVEIIGTCEDRYKVKPNTIYFNQSKIYSGNSFTCACPQQNGVFWDDSYGVCVPPAANLSITLLGMAETRPEKTNGSSTTELTAKVASNGQSKSGVAVAFSVEVVDKSGGHDHSDTNRPKGKLSATGGVTDANGEAKVVFQAPQIAGKYVVTASCNGCTAPATRDILVRVPDLVNIFTLPFRDSQWAYPGIGQTGEHLDQHYLTVAAATRMLDISRKFQKIWPAAPKLTLNDASLVWGGKFDIAGSWERNPRAHAEHRIGDNIDIRANTALGAVPANIRAAVVRWLRKTSKPEDNIPPEFVIESVNPLHEGIGTANEHLHLRLGN